MNEPDLTPWLTWVETCYGCERPYDECGDVSMDHETWKKISPTGNEGGLLCANCIMDRLSQAGLSGVVVTFYPPRLTP